MRTRMRCLLFVGLLQAFMAVAQGARTTSVYRPTLLRLQDQAVHAPEGWVFLPVEGNPFYWARQGGGGRELRLSTHGVRFGYRAFRNGYVWDVLRFPDPGQGAEPGFKSCVMRLDAADAAGAWEQAFELDTTYGLTHYVVPLEKEDRFLGISPFTGYIKDGKASLAAVFKAHSGRLRLDKLVDFRAEGSKAILNVETVIYPLPPAGPGEPPNRRPRVIQRCVADPPALRPDLWLPAILKEDLALASTQAGVVWILSLKTGDVRRRIDLGRVDHGDLGKLAHLDHFILAAAPDASGQLVVATRSHEIFAFATAYHTPDGSPEEVRRRNQQQFLDVAQEMDAIDWWVVDPDTGEATRADASGGFPGHMPYNLQGSLRFVMGPNNKAVLHGSSDWKAVLAGMGLATPKAHPAKPGASRDADPGGTSPQGRD